MIGYDVLYQEWLDARRVKDYARADAIRDTFEREHGLTIFSEGEQPIEGVTVRRMKASDWEKKYGNPRVGRIIEEQDSKIKQLYPRYTGSRKFA